MVGASGPVGSELSRLLREQGNDVIGTTSKKVEKFGLRYLNVLTGDGLAECFKDIETAFLMSPTGISDQFRVLYPMIQEAKNRKVRKVVLMTVLGANADPKGGFRKAEIELEKSGLNYCIIRPNWFMQNFDRFWTGSIHDQGKLRLPGGNSRVSFIDTRDIAAVAAKLIGSDERINQDFDLTGTEAITMGEAAAEISKACGAEIPYEEISIEAFQAEMTKAGYGADYVALMGKLLGALKAGYGSWVTEEVQTVLGRDPIQFSSYAQDHSEVWRKAVAA